MTPLIFTHYVPLILLHGIKFTYDIVYYTVNYNNL